VPKDTHRTATTDPAQLELPEWVTVAVAELASAAREGLLALAVGTGLQVLQVMLDEDVTRLVGARGRHNPDRTAVRHGSEQGQVTLGGRRVRVRRPRVRTADGAGEVAVPTYQAFASTELLDQLAVERMLAKLSCRRYPAGLEPVGSQAEQTATGTSRSAVSRRFVARTEHAWPNCSPRTCPPWTWSRSWWTASEWPSTAVWSRLASPSTGPRSRSGWSRAPPRTPPWSVTCWPGCGNVAWR
jgi:putative transposase